MTRIISAFSPASSDPVVKLRICESHALNKTHAGLNLSRKHINDDSPMIVTSQANPTEMKMDQTGYFALDSNALPWEERINPHLPAAIFRKVLHTDAETGVFFQLVRYPRGVVNPTHTHPCAHAIYVLEGTLVTHRGRYGPGAFVWFPEGEVMEHGAGADGDVTVLLVSNKPFAIEYLGPPPSLEGRTKDAT